MISLRKGKRLEAIAWALGMLSLAYWVAVAFTGFHDPFIRLTALALLQHGCFFAVGILISVIDRKGVNAPRVLLAVILLIPAWLQIAATRQSESAGLSYAAPTIVPFTTWLFVCGLITASVFLKDRVAVGLERYAPTIRLIGLSTYPLYLVHMHIGFPLLIEARRAHIPDGVSLMLAVAGAIAIAWIVAKHLEPLVHAPLAAALKAVLPEPSRA